MVTVDDGWCWVMPAGDAQRYTKKRMELGYEYRGDMSTDGHMPTRVTTYRIIDRPSDTATSDTRDKTRETRQDKTREEKTRQDTV